MARIIHLLSSQGIEGFVPGPHLDVPESAKEEDCRGHQEQEEDQGKVAAWKDFWVGDHTRLAEAKIEDQS
jgi:hypothetical protein